MSDGSPAGRPAALARDGAGVRIAVIDSGVASGHPHVGEVSEGIWMRDDDTSPEFADRIGHGTAVAGAIHDLAPAATLIAVRIFERRLSTTSVILARAIRWAAGEGGASLINLSLGTTNLRQTEMLLAAVADAHAAGAIVVGAERDGDLPCLPGSLGGTPGGEGVLAVRVDPDAARDRVTILAEPARPVLAASPYPKSIPGVSTERNLSGVSFAVANVTGLMARLLARESGVMGAADLVERLRRDQESSGADTAAKR
ncbi:MAG: S8 family serine peptidase [Gemmatimonadaceae bacterium]